MVTYSKKMECEAVVVTFEPHPVKFLFPNRQLKFLFPRQDQINVMKSLGVNVLVIEPFSRMLSQTSARRFINEWIVRPLSPRKLMVGYDFSFGSNKEGSIDVLKEICDSLKIDLEIVSPIKVENIISSSSQVRKFLLEGKMSLANKMLGRNFYLKGIIIKGNERGKKIGIPTANLLTQNEIIPKSAVYITKIWIGGSSHDSITNVGLNPTFNLRETVQIETNIFDFSGELYGEEVKLEFIEYVRSEEKFSSIDELTTQIKKDCDYARSYFKKKH